MERKCLLNKKIGIVIFFTLLQSCCWFNDDCDECFEDANLWFPETVTNIEITRTLQPTFIGNQFYPNGTSVGVFNNVFVYNEFFSVTKYVQGINQNVIFFWNRDTPPNFSNLEDGEIVTYYKTVVNRRFDNSLECAFANVEEVKSILEVRVRTNDTGEIIGQREVEQTIFNIPSGQYGTFHYSFEFLACGNYEFDIQIDPEGQLSETSVNDNNYSEVQEDFGFCF
ncbi:hypothetical protein WNY78_09660 [Psychroserpens sp. AS72]|uniref:hypothetical protein n=1 Tax=Psychroserpens sp. AS72 TaxID=3135775 RepID=UPI00317287B2